MDRASRLLQKLDREKSRVFTHASSLSLPQLLFKPSPESWSVLEVLDHVSRVERAMLAVWKENLPNGHPVAPPERFRALIVRCVMRSPVKVKVPRGAESVLPAASASLAGIAAGTSQTRNEIQQLLDTLSSRQHSRGFVRHPVSGWMTPSMTLAFLRAHLRHHRYQISKLIRSPDFPTTP
jgi:uncharacterized damage-inducible protein DinB